MRGALRSLRGRGAAAALLPLLLLPACSSTPTAGEGGSGGGGGRTAPELVLDGVTVRHAAADGVRGRVEAKRATYSLAEKVVRARDVVVRVPSPRGDAEVDAPAAEWGTEKGLLSLPEGASASLPGGYRAVLARGEVDLAARVLRGEGEASLAGPGFTVSGNGLAWDLKGGTGSLSAPKARISPRVLSRKG